jgi:hypothetical protein
MHISRPKQQAVMRSIEDGSLYGHPKQHVQPSHFYLHEPPAWSMLAVNVVAMHMILNYASKA